ncbi:hypothetical protein Tco_0188905 [Tanacetum coccineum]
MAYSGHLPLPSSLSLLRYLHLRPTFITISAAYTTPRGYPPPNHHRGGGRTTVQPPQPHLVVTGCDGATPWDASSGHPPKTTTVVAAEPTVTTTAAPWYMLASLDGMECGYRRTWTW